MDGESDAFANTDSGGAHEAESIGLQGVGETELLLQALIVLQRKRSWQIVVAWGKVLATNEVWLQEMPLVGQVAQHTPELDETRLPNEIAERRMLLAEEAEPAQQMRISAQLGKFAQVGESSVEISQKVAGAGAILFHGPQLEGSGQDLDLAFEEVVEGGLRWLHDIVSGADKRTRWATARANSRQTSCGAICT
jgi:hypothetical protein